VGQSVALKVKRGSRDVDATVRVEDLPEVSAPKVQVLRELELVTVTPAIRAERNIRAESGALIYNVSPRVAQQIGVQPGDVIVQINRTRVTGADVAAKALDYYGGRGYIQMFFEHQGRIYSTDFAIR
jgi:serine protease Do